MIKLLPVVGNDSRDFFCLFPGLLPGRAAPSSPGIEPIMPEDGVHAGRRSSRSPAGMKKRLLKCQEMVWRCVVLPYPCMMGRMLFEREIL